MRKLSLASLLLLSGCSGETIRDPFFSVDAGGFGLPFSNNGDGGIPFDAGTLGRSDGGVSPDGGVSSDASSSPVDGGTFVDGSSREDSGPACDSDASPVIQLGQLSVTSASGGAPRKGEPARVTVPVNLSAGCPTSARLSLTLSSDRFTDFEDVPVGDVEVPLALGDNTAAIEIGLFLDDAARDMHFALGSGPYRITSVTARAGTAAPVTLSAAGDGAVPGGSFDVATSEHLLIPVVYDEDYLSGIEGNTAATAEAYLEQVMTRPAELFTPSSNADPDGDGTYERFEGGFDEMMGVVHHFHAFPDFPGDFDPNQGWCEDATGYAAQVLGMTQPWVGQPRGTRPERHGFDYLIALTPDMGGGVACGWIDVQVSSFIYRDVDRQQIVAVHESGHIFGAPHCDDVGNGSGDSLQGYVMCSGEKHPRYPEAFVWHRTSYEHMRNNYPGWN